jgi:hypothetical protein
MDDASLFRQAMTEDQAKFDAHLPVRFEWFDEEDPTETKKCGYPRYKRIQIIRTLIPGSKDERVDRVREEHKRRFPRAWAAFLAGEEGVVDGTPLKAFPGLSKDDISTAVHFHVLSVEQLASMSDEHIGNLGHGWRGKRDGAKNWLASQRSAQPMAELNAQLEDERQKRQALEDRLATLEAHGNGAKGPQTPVQAPPKKRNRKPKVVPAES